MFLSFFNQVGIAKQSVLSAASSRNVVFVLVLFSTVAYSQMPSGFHWVDFKQEGSTVSKIEQALKAENYTAIREIGVKDGFALVVVVARESTEATPAGDRWIVYSVSTDNMNVKTLLNGYSLEIKDWAAFKSAADRDLAVQYMDCWECEPSIVFTALHYKKGQGWRARWPNEKDKAHPGIDVVDTGVGDPYTDEDVSQVFAVFAPIDGVAVGGSWYRSRDLRTGKITEMVSKFYVDPLTGADESVQIAGKEATQWKLRLCKSPDAQYTVGQSSKACKQILATGRKPTNK